MSKRKRNSMSSPEGSDIDPSEEGLEIDDSNEEYDEMIMIPNMVQMMKMKDQKTKTRFAVVWIGCQK